MKKILIVTFIAILACFTSTVRSQNPVTWTDSVYKIGTDISEIHLIATIQSGWHIYAQTQPEDAIAVPTAIKFDKNSLIIRMGNPKEVGNKIEFKDSELGISAWQYKGKVDFVQTIKLKVDNTSTTVSGTIRFQLCTEEKCLPPATISFSVKINETKKTD